MFCPYLYSFALEVLQRVNNHRDKLNDAAFIAVDRYGVERLSTEAKRVRRVAKLMEDDIFIFAVDSETVRHWHYSFLDQTHSASPRNKSCGIFLSITKPLSAL